MPDFDLDSIALRQLIVRTRAGDRAAEDKLVRAILGRFRNLAGRMLAGFPDVQYRVQTADVVQDALMRLLRALKDVTPQTTRDFFNLAAEQIRRELLDLARRAKGRQSLPLQISDGSSAGNAVPADPAPPLRDLDRWEQFHSAVEDLPVEQREVFGLTYYHGWTQAQIAELFEVDERTIRRRMRTAVRALNAAVGGQLP